jgi:two-component system NtrC family response regulator
VGDNQPITVDVRVVCATHRSLEDMVSTGDFREDLLFRINTFEVAIPPLRDRVDDLPELVRHFVHQARPQTPPDAVVALPEVFEVLAHHRWPGNVRELANVIEHALVLCDELPLSLEHLPVRLGASLPRATPSATAVTGVAADANGAPVLQTVAQPVLPPVATMPPRKPESLRELEMRAILEGLERNQGNKARTAEELGISLKTLYNKLHQLQEAAPVA